MPGIEPKQDLLEFLFGLGRFLTQFELSMLSTVLSMLRIESDFMSRRLNACMASELALSLA